MEDSQLPVPFWRGWLPWVILAETAAGIWGVLYISAWLLPRVNRSFSIWGVAALDLILIAIGWIVIMLFREAWPDAWIARRWTVFMIFVLALTVAHIGFAGHLVPWVEGWAWPTWALLWDIPGLMLTLLYLWGWGLGLGFLSLLFMGRSITLLFGNMMDSS